MSWLSKAHGIKAFIFDIDGVLTDGTIAYNGSEVAKSFHIRDGLAMKMAIHLGYIVGLLSGRDDASNRQRAHDLKISFYYGDLPHKLAALERVLTDYNLRPDQCLYVGDDIIDIPLIRTCGIGVCVADAVPEVQAVADWQTQAMGGGGAAREVIARILQEQGRWDEAIRPYL